MFLKNNLSVASDSGPMQTILAAMEINPKCTGKIFATTEWASCNINSKVQDETTKMAEFAKEHNTMRVICKCNK